MFEILVPAREELFENPMGAMDFLPRGRKKAGILHTISGDPWTIPKLMHKPQAKSP